MLAYAFDDILQRIIDAARGSGRPIPSLVAVSKGQSVAAVAELATFAQARTVRAPRLGQEQNDPVIAIGENYVQEAMAKQAALGDTSLQWHLIGHLQSNKAQQAANMFDWVQTVDRIKLVAALDRFRPPDREPLNVLIEVNIDDEPSKHGCKPMEMESLAHAIAQAPQLKLRGLMAIPTPHPQLATRRSAFARARHVFETLRSKYPQADTLSMGMSDDFELAIAEGATMVRVGTALFGARVSDQRGQA